MLLARECEWINPGDGVIIQGDRLDLIRDGLGRDCSQPVEGDVRGGRAGAAEHGGVLVWQVPPHLGHSQRGQLAPAETLPRSVSWVYRITLVQISCLLSIIFE